LVPKDEVRKVLFFILTSGQHVVVAPEELDKLRRIMASKKKPQTKKTTAKEPKAPAASEQPEKLSALDAAARVLGESRQAMNCKELIETMAAKGYWTSPGGKSPAATLAAALLREIQTKKEASRFRKTEPGKFGLA
jgi:hypothetical protein